MNKEEPRIAVLVPCYNEEKTVATVVSGFKQSLPEAVVYVYDNNSTDNTAEVALKAGAIVSNEERQGKGYVVRRMFADIEADIYILVDGDATYEAAAANRLVRTMLNGPYDKVNCVRIHSDKEAFRTGHILGNKLLTWLVSIFFGARSSDMLSGYKALSKRFVKTFPSTSRGFEIETEILVHALDMDIPMQEIDTIYSERPIGSFSKLSTFRDGFRILGLITMLVRDLMPLRFFLAVGSFFLALSLGVGLRVIIEFYYTGLVQRLPTALLALGLMILAVLAFFAGLILDSVSRGRREIKLLAYLSY